MAGQAESSRTRAAAGYVLPPLLFMTAIFLLGTDVAAAGETRSLLERLLRALLPGVYAGLSADALAALNGALRKTAHFVAYAALAALNFRAVLGLRGRAGLPGAAAAWGLATAWAAVDEYHQSFAASRGASAADVLLDSAGAASAVLLLLHFWEPRWDPQWKTRTKPTGRG